MYRIQAGSAAARVEPGYCVETDPTGRYARFEEILGKGATKTVYKAIDEVLGIEVAWNQVKLNGSFKSPDELQRLISEVHLLSTLNHDSIMKFHTSWVDVDGRAFNFITEMFTSGTLRNYRKKYRRLHIRVIKNWAVQILHGLVYLHSHDPPVIHRDLKCDNLFVNGHLGQVKIGDLGLAAILQGSRAAHSIIGTPEFMAPELYDENYNELVDVYSFGMCVLEMLTCEYPYIECTNPAQIYKKVTSGKLPEAFHRIKDSKARKFIGKCLANVSCRVSARELLHDPFLLSDEDDRLPGLKFEMPEPFLNGRDVDNLRARDNPLRTDMLITGKLNPEGDTIFLKVQIADRNGSARNVYFPFDVLNDTPIDVAKEMVKELEIMDWEAEEIADMIGGEISALVPNWTKQDMTDYNQENDDGFAPPFLSFSSGSSSQASPSGFTAYRENEIASDYAITVRLYGPNTEYVIDREREFHAIKYLSAAGFGAKLLAVFGNGMVQSFINARTLIPEDMRKPKLVAEIAKQLHKFHQVEIPGSKEPQLWNDIFKFFEKASDLKFDHNEKRRKYETISFKEIHDELLELKELTGLLNAPVVFGHNDLLCGNIMVNDEEGKLYFIDFEYGSYNYRGYDIGNHFNEFAGYECDYSLYPSKDEQYHFFRHYLMPDKPQEVSDKDLEALYIETNTYMLASHLFWALWGLIQAKMSPINFDYMEYFFLRYNEFKRQKQSAISLAKRYLTGS